MPICGEGWYRIHSDDLAPPLPNTRKHTVQAYHKQLKDYTVTVYQSYAPTKMRGETLWCHVITRFRPATIRTSIKAKLIESVDILAVLRVYLHSDRITGPKDKLTELLYRESHIGTRSSPTGGIEPQTQAVKSGDTTDEKVQARIVRQAEKKANGNGDAECGTVPQIDTCATETPAPGGPDGTDDEDSPLSNDGSDHAPDDGTGFGKSSNRRMESPPTSLDWCGEIDRSDEREEGYPPSFGPIKFNQPVGVYMKRPLRQLQKTKVKPRNGAMRRSTKRGEQCS